MQPSQGGYIWALGALDPNVKNDDDDDGDATSLSVKFSSLRGFSGSLVKLCLLITHFQKLALESGGLHILHRKRAARLEEKLPRRHVRIGRVGNARIASHMPHEKADR